MKDTVNKVLVALAAVAGFFGFANLVGAANFLVDNLDAVWAAGLTLIGVVVTLYGFFKPVTPSTAEIGDVKTTIATVLIAVGSIAAFLGLAKLTEIVNFLLTNLDAVYAAVLTLIGVISGLVVYFRKPEGV